MPSPAQILQGLTLAAQEGWPLAVVWHALILVAAAALLAGWRPDRRHAGVLLAAPIASVSAMAWIVGNPFNGGVFALLAVVLTVVALRLPPVRVSTGPMWALLLGVVMIGFGWVYPEFTGPGNPLGFLYRSPFGLIPCPTLSGVIGFALVGGGIGCRAWSLVLAAAGVFYALVGTFRLGVRIDLFLLVGALALAIVALKRTGSPRA